MKKASRRRGDSGGTNDSWRLGASWGPELRKPTGLCCCSKRRSRRLQRLRDVALFSSLSRTCHSPLRPEVRSPAATFPPWELCWMPLVWTSVAALRGALPVQLHSAPPNHTRGPVSTQPRLSAQGSFVSDEAFARAGQSEAAAALLREEAEESICLGPGLPCRIFGRNGRRQLSLQMVRREVELGCLSELPKRNAANTYHKRKAYSIVIKAFAQEGRPSEATEGSPTQLLSLAHRYLIIRFQSRSRQLSSAGSLKTGGCRMASTAS